MTVIVDLNMVPESGDVVVAEIAGGTVLRRYWPTGDAFRLLADNGDYPEIAPDHAAAAMLLGVVVERRRFRPRLFCGRALPMQAMSGPLDRPEESVAPPLAVKI